LSNSASKATSTPYCSSTRSTPGRCSPGHGEACRRIAADQVGVVWHVGGGESRCDYGVAPAHRRAFVSRCLSAAVLDRLTIQRQLPVEARREFVIEPPQSAACPSTTCNSCRRKHAARVAAQKTVGQLSNKHRTKVPRPRSKKCPRQVERSLTH
jgi:hypothetical protein